MRKFLLTLAVAALAAPVAIASDDHSGHDMSSHEGMSDGVKAEATINSISGNTINLTHGPIAEIGWPAMTMDLMLLDGANVGDVAEGDDAIMVLEKGADGMFGIRALMPKP